MSTTITGLGSGFDIESWVTQLVEAKQASTVTPLQTKLSNLNTKSDAIDDLETKFKALKSALESFTKIVYGSSSDMWTNTSITSSNDAYATATSSGSVSSGNIELQIEQVATATTAKSAQGLGLVTPENIKDTEYSLLANGQTKAGTFSMFLDGKQYEINIGEHDTLGDIMADIEEVSGGKIKAQIDENGSFSIKAYNEAGEVDTNAVLTLGSSGDKSNFASALKLNNAEGTYSYTSAYPVSVVNTDETFASGNSGLEGLLFTDEDGNLSSSGSGTITINGVEFEVDSSMSINNLMTKINGNADVNCTASYDSLTNKFILTSTETGQKNISLSSEGTNLLNVLGLTEGSGEDEKIKDGSQELGQNAIAYINGNKVISTSNTITGESSGISNLSINIKKTTSDYSNNPDDDKTVTLSVEPDYTEVKEALQKFVDAYNDAVSSAKSAITSTGAIGHDSSLSSILNNIRGITSMISDNDGSLSLLSEIGISTSSTDAVNLTIDSTKLDEALKENFDSVKSLLSDGYKSEEDNGLFDRLLKTLNTALDTTNGYFVQKSESITQQITSMNSRIERANEKLANYESRLYTQFNAMDATISSLNAQLTTFSAYIG